MGEYSVKLFSTSQRISYIFELVLNTWRLHNVYVSIMLCARRYIYIYKYMFLSFKGPRGMCSQGSDTTDRLVTNRGGEVTSF